MFGLTASPYNAAFLTQTQNKSTAADEYSKLKSNITTFFLGNLNTLYGSCRTEIEGQELDNLHILLLSGFEKSIDETNSVCTTPEYNHTFLKEENNGVTVSIGKEHFFLSNYSLLDLQINLVEKTVCASEYFSPESYKKAALLIIHNLNEYTEFYIEWATQHITNNIDKDKYSSKDLELFAQGILLKSKEYPSVYSYALQQIVNHYQHFSSSVVKSAAQEVLGNTKYSQESKKNAARYIISNTQHYSLCEISQAANQLFNNTEDISQNHLIEAARHIINNIDLSEEATLNKAANYIMENEQFFHPSSRVNAKTYVDSVKTTQVKPDIVTILANGFLDCLTNPSASKKSFEGDQLYFYLVFNILEAFDQRKPSNAKKIDIESEYDDVILKERKNNLFISCNDQQLVLTNVSLDMLYRHLIQNIVNHPTKYPEDACVRAAQHILENKEAHSDSIFIGAANYAVKNCKDYTELATKAAVGHIMSNPGSYTEESLRNALSIYNQINAVSTLIADAKIVVKNNLRFFKAPIAEREIFLTFLENETAKAYATKFTEILWADPVRYVYSDEEKSYRKISDYSAWIEAADKIGGENNFSAVLERNLKLSSFIVENKNHEVFALWNLKQNL